MTQSYVRRLCRSGALAATRQGRDWLVDVDALTAFTLRRSA